MIDRQFRECGATPYSQCGEVCNHILAVSRSRSMAKELNYNYVGSKVSKKAFVISKIIAK